MKIGYHDKRNQLSHGDQGHIELISMQTITIIGYGRFGKVLYRLLKDDFDVQIYNRSRIPNPPAGEIIIHDLKKAYERDVIFYAIPINAFEKVLSEHKKYLRDEHVLIDTLSVKMHPKKIFIKQLKNTKIQALLTHPMFGPDSVGQGFEGLPIIIEQLTINDKNYTFWKDYFEKKSLHVLEIKAEEHDKLAADSQGLTHFIGRLLEEYGMKKTPIDSIGTQKLLEVKEQTTNDTWQLFTDLQQYNPYTKNMQVKLGDAYEKIYTKLQAKKKGDKISFGIQGGKGSFNEEAIMYHIKRNTIKNYEIKYLHTSENVLRALHEGAIDQGIFALHNSVGGVVYESIEVMGRYKFAVVEEFAITISHTLMIRKDATLKDITTIMTHPQVLAQCRTTLSQKYTNLEKTSGEGELIDHALVAKHLSEKKLPKNIAVMGSKILAEIYGLHIVEDNLQDLKENYTSFLLVKRI
jgi:arogenate dehydrogenase (NADP+)